MKRTYTYQVLEGSAKEVGRKEAEYLKTAKPEIARVYAAPFEGKTERLEEGEKLLEMNERWCPGLNEEIEGFAEELDVQPESVFYYTGSIPRTGNCSQFAALPDRAGGRTLCARSYEWTYDDELTLMTTRITGRAAHTGFTVMCFGRLDGINERGLWVSMTATNPNPEGRIPDTVGFRFWSLIRTILDRAGSVEEAVALAEPFPLAFHIALLVADQYGNAALIEKAPDSQAVRRFTTGIVVSTNHYTAPEMKPLNSQVFTHSTKRYDFLRKSLRDGKITPERIQTILAGSFPNGLSCHYYREYFGTLWSSYADPATGTLTVCFGPADIAENVYRTFGLTDPVGTTPFTAELPDEKAGSGMWDRIPNGTPRP